MTTYKKTQRRKLAIDKFKKLSDILEKDRCKLIKSLKIQLKILNFKEISDKEVSLLGTMRMWDYEEGFRLKKVKKLFSNVTIGEYACYSFDGKFLGTDAGYYRNLIMWIREFIEKFEREIFPSRITAVLNNITKCLKDIGYGDENDNIR